jgi:hypothetical protein
MARDFAVGANGHAFLYFYKSSHLAVIAYLTTVGVYKAEDAYIGTKLHIVEALPIVIYSNCFHLI